MVNRAERLVLARLRYAVIAGVTIAVATMTVGCASSSSREVELPPQTLTDAPTSVVEEEAALVSSGAGAAARPIGETSPDAPHGGTAPIPEPAGRRHTIVIQPAAGDGEVTPQTLQQASTSERERRAAAEAPVAVITNSNLAELAEGVELTVLGSPAAQSLPAAADAAGTSQPAAAAAAAKAPSEEYWRGQALKLRLDWKAAVETVGELESEVQELRRRFYEEDDPFYRDNQIKPAWDRALDRLAAAKTEAEGYERRLERFLDEGRTAGALPGWLREGVEFEPPPTAERTPAERRRSDDPWEPRILHEDPRDP